MNTDQFTAAIAGELQANGSVQHLTPEPFTDADLGVGVGLDESPEESTWTLFPESAWTGLFARWRDIAAPVTEAPVEHLWLAFLLASGLIIGRSRWISNPRPIYPNFYTLLIGNTGDSRKSTTLWLAEELITRVGAEIEIIRNPVSSEGLYEQLAQREETHALVYADEFRSLLSVAKRKGTQDILPRLQSLHSSPARDTITRREDSTTIIKPFVSLITATPLAFVQDLLGENEITGGFLNRFLIIAGNVQAPKPRAVPPLESAWSSISIPLGEVRRKLLEGAKQFEFSPSADELWGDFYTRWRLARTKVNQRVADLTARTFEHVIKIAAVYSILAGEEAVSGRALAIAIKVGDWLESNAREVFGETGLDRRSKAQNAILRQLKKSKTGALYVRVLQQNLSGTVTGAEFRDALKILADNDLVSVREIVAGSGQKRKVVELTSLTPTPNHAKKEAR